MNNLETNASDEALCQILTKSDAWFQRRRFLKKFKFPHLPIIGQIKKIRTKFKFSNISTTLNKLETYASDEAICKIFIKSDTWFQRRRFFKKIKFSHLLYNGSKFKNS